MSNSYAELQSKFGGKFRETTLRDTDYKNKKVYWLEFYGATCPICGHKSWCMVNVTGTKVICQRVPNEHKLDSINGYLYYLDKNAKVNFNIDKYQERTTYKKTDDNTLDLFYRAILLAYPLDKKHRQDLYKRGMTDEMINLHGGRGFGTYYQFTKESLNNGIPHPYFTQEKYALDGEKLIINNVWNNMLKNLRESTNNSYYSKDLWHGVPGFSLQEITVKNRSYFSPIFKGPVDGLLVPYYNELNQLVGFQSRVDHVSTWTTITKDLPVEETEVYLNSKTRQYTIYRKITEDDRTKLATGVAKGNVVDIKVPDWQGNPQPYQFKIEEGGKYFWVSSSKEDGGASGRVPIEVAYNPEIAKLDPSDPVQKQKIQDYIKKPKSIWLTEGGLKGLITASYLPKHFSNEDLDKFGRDVLAVAGVNSYRHFLPMLKKLNVKTVTTAYDMDFQHNEQVFNNYKSLIRMLRENGFKVRVANWNGDEAKGIDDALVKNLEINFQEQEAK